MQTALQPGKLIRFGVFEADIDGGELRKNGVRVKIQDLPFRALKCLISRPQEVISRDEFRQALWPEGVFVDFDHGISSAINRLRDALGDSADNPVFIETVERRGYRWIAPTRIPVPAMTAVGPVLVKPVLGAQGEKQDEVAGGRSDGWRWSLVFPAASLFLLFWVIWPSHHHVATAGSVQPPANIPNTTPHHSADAEAEQFYLRGRFYWQERTPDGLNKAVDAFTQSIVRDPNFAPGYVGLADCYNLLREYTVMPASEAYPRALAAARKAVELDDHSSEAHAALAFASFYGTWDGTKAEIEFHRALELNPNNASAHHWYATFLATTGRNSEALAEIQRAQALDPTSKAILADKGTLLLALGHHDEGLALLKQLATSEPTFISPHRYLKSAYFAAGDYADFFEEWKKEATLVQDKASLRLLQSSEKAYASGGYRGMMQEIEVQQKRLYDRGSLSPYPLAITNSLLGNKQEALRYLKIAYDQHDDDVIIIQSEAAFNNLHDEPAYQELVAKFAFPAR